MLQLHVWYKLESDYFPPPPKKKAIASVGKAGAICNRMCLKGEYPGQLVLDNREKNTFTVERYLK
jgi:hypothetical protein